MVERELLTKVSKDKVVTECIETKTGSRKIIDCDISLGHLQFSIHCHDIINTERLNTLVNSGQIEKAIKESLKKVMSPQSSVGKVKVNLDKEAYSKEMKHHHAKKLGKKLILDLNAFNTSYCTVHYTS